MNQYLRQRLASNGAWFASGFGRTFTGHEGVSLFLAHKPCSRLNDLPVESSLQCLMVGSHGSTVFERDAESSSCEHCKLHRSFVCVV